MMSRRTIGAAGVAAGLLLAFSLGAMLAAAPTQDAPPQGGPAGGMPDLVGGLRATEGCFGVENGQMMSGKQSIFAWFENKQAVVRWYRGEMHQGVMEMIAPGLTPDYGPLEHVADDEGPILVIATLTMSDEPHFESMPNLPISQISIELYKPLPGGAYLGARLAPDAVEVDNMRNYTPATGD